jgi:hypothetical protein
MADVMLTTIDNPYNPFTQFDRWYVFDCQRGYDTCAILARISRNSDELSETDQEIAIEEAINEMLFFNVSGKHKKVYRNAPELTT